MTLVGRMRVLRRAGIIRRLGQAYTAQPVDEAARLAAQLASWNAEWQRVCTHVPYFRRLHRERVVPTQFSSWEEFRERVPIMTRATVQQYKRELTSEEKPQDWVRMTGGSTAKPVQIPAWNSERTFTEGDLWLGRSWYDISPGSRLFMLWGHSHLLGNGFKGRINAHKRMFFDWLLGYRRFSAYNLQPGALRHAAKVLIDFRPEYVIGYSVALDLFARANADLRERLRTLGVKVIVATGEGFPSADSESRLAELFGCSVAMEYGAVETALIAHTQPSGGYQVFWRTCFIEAERTRAHAAGHTIRVTSLYPRCFPLVRYEIGDEVELWEEEGNLALGVTSFKRVQGRCNDYVLLQDGAVIHSEVFSHVVRPCAAVAGYQVVQRNGDISLHLICADPLPKEQVRAMQARLTKVHPQLAAVTIERVAQLQQTIAGKFPMVLRQ